MSDLTVRQATAADLDAAVPLFDGYRRFQGEPADLPGARAFLKARFEHGDSVVFLAEAAVGAGTGRPAAVGFAQLYPIYSSVAMARVFILNDLFVAEAGRRRGVASALLAAVEAHGRRFGAVRLSLNVTRDNTPGQALYAGRGWQRDEQFFMYHCYPMQARPSPAQKSGGPFT